MGLLFNDGHVTFGTTVAGALLLGFYGIAPVAIKKAPAALGAFKAGTAGFETEAEAKKAYEMLVEVRARLKELNLWE